MRRVAASLVTLAAVFAGCGFGAGDERDGGVELRVTRDFGHTELAADSAETVREDDSVMRFLQSRHDVETRFGGNFVQAIDGLAGDASEERDWFYFVNGIEADEGASDWELEPGDVVQWDHRDWGAAQRIPAIVGAYPEPFLSGTRGERLPVRLECADAESQACQDVKATLTEDGVPVATAQIGASAGGELLRVLVGPWNDLRALRSVAVLAEGPDSSGVFARVVDDGLELLDEHGEVVREAPAGSGLVAATALEELAITWIITGVDEVGVQAAAAALDEATLRNAFALAATPDGALKLPLVEEDE